jgi:hypothetical protein
MTQKERTLVLCQRLQNLGYAQHRKIRLYGEELHLVSNPSPDGDGFAIEGIAKRSGKLTHMRIPLSVVHVLRRELEIQERSLPAA